MVASAGGWPGTEPFIYWWLQPPAISSSFHESHNTINFLAEAGIEDDECCISSTTAGSWGQGTSDWLLGDGSVWARGKAAIGAFEEDLPV